MKTGPKKIEVDEDLLKKLAEAGLNVRQIAMIIGMSESQLTRRKDLMAHVNLGNAIFGYDIRTLLIEKAREGDTTTLIYMDRITNKTRTAEHEDNIKIKQDTLDLKKRELEIRNNIGEELAQIVFKGIE